MIVRAPRSTRFPYPTLFRASLLSRVRREAWHPQGPPTSTQPPRATTSRGTPPHRQATARWTDERGRGAVRDVVARGWVGGGWALVGARRWNAPNVSGTEPPLRSVLAALMESLV